MTRRKNKLSIPIHFVWATHDRLPLVTPEIERDVFRYIQKICQDERCTVLALALMPDHVHLLVELAPIVSPSYLMKQVQGSSSRFITQTLKRGDWFAWQGHYGAFAADGSDLSRLLHYIAHQKEHHANGTVIDAWEKTFEEYEVETDEANP